MEVFQWTIAAFPSTGGHCGKTIDNGHSPDHFPKNGIILVKMWSSAQGFVHFPLVDRNFSSFQPEGFYRIQPCIGKYLSLYDIKLAAGTGFLWIGIIALPGGRQGSFFMKQVGTKFGRYRVVGTAAAQLCAGGGMPARRVAGLYHKVFNDPVKEETVVKMLFHQLSGNCPGAGGWHPKDGGSSCPCRSPFPHPCKGLCGAGHWQAGDCRIPL